VQDLLVGSSAILSNGNVADEHIFRRSGLLMNVYLGDLVREVERFEEHVGESG
jgi:hypothetical protein